MRKFLILIIIVFCQATSQTYGQSTNLREVFLTAESYYLFEEFDEALPLYLKINKEAPDNYNILFKIGACYLNTPYEKEKSIPYLERAVKKINSKYRENNYRETSAPPEAMFFLGHAYRINNQLDKAKEAYINSLEILDEKQFDIDLVRDKIRSIDVAKELMNNPSETMVEILPDWINTRFTDINPVVSGNEQHLVYVSRLQFYDAVYYSEKINNEWSKSRNIMPELGVDGDVYPTGLSWDGTELFVYRSDNYIGNIYYSKRSGNKWTPLVKLNNNINTKYWESHASISKDGNLLYFASNRINGYGGLDIYVSAKTGDGDWGIAVNLGPTINTRYNEDTPFITEDGKKLYFSSFGHYNMGGYDIFESVKKADGSWSKPRNLGFPINTTDDDQFFHPVRNGQFAYYSSYKEDGFGRHDIYRYEIFGPDNPRFYPVSGFLDYSGQRVEPGEVHVHVRNLKNNVISAELHPGQDGSFRFEVPAGSYKLAVNSEKFISKEQNINVMRNLPKSGLIIPGKILLTPVPVASVPQVTDYGPVIILKDTFIITHSDKEIRLSYEAERGDQLTIRVYENSVLTVTDTVSLESRKQTFDLSPAPGITMVEFTMADIEGNTVSRTAKIINSPGKVPVSEWIAGSVQDSSFTPQPDLSKLHELLNALKEAGITEVHDLINQITPFTSGNLHQFLLKFKKDESGINLLEEFIVYTIEKSDMYGYNVEDLSNAIAALLKESDISGEIKSKLSARSSKIFLYSGIIIFLFAILILIIFLLRKNKNRENTSASNFN